jgi:GTP cyclohydrolase II
VTTLLDDLDRARALRRPPERPFVTVAYAQSMDGSITRASGGRFRLSGPDAMRMTHAIRGRHDAILVGVGTVLADDPELSVRLVEGADPQPIVVDSRLRTPPSARLLARAERRPWIATTTIASSPSNLLRSGMPTDVGLRGERGRVLQSRGARLMAGPELPNGWVDLRALLRSLRIEGIEDLMVEGGAEIISSFMAARLVDYAVVTVAPLFLGGLSVLRPGWGAADESGGRSTGEWPCLDAWVSHRFGNDLVMAGEVRWRAP